MKEIQKRKSKLLILLIFFLLLDQVAKYYIQLENIHKEIIPNFFSIYYVQNDGIAFSFLEGSYWIIIISNIILFVVILIVFWKNKISTYNIFLVAILTGALGNILDRLINGYVIDFLRFEIADYVFPIFNFADIYLVMGTIFLIIAIYITERKTNAKDKSGE